MKERPYSYVRAFFHVCSVCSQVLRFGQVHQNVAVNQLLSRYSRVISIYSHLLYDKSKTE